MFFIAASLALLTILTTLPQLSIDSPYYTWLKIQNYFYSFSYLVFLIVYIIVLKLLTSRLKHFYPQFYRTARKTILVTNFLIIGSISARIIIAIVIANI